MSIVVRSLIDNEIESLEEKINSRYEVVSELGVPKEEDPYLQQMCADLELLKMKRRELAVDSVDSGDSEQFRRLKVLDGLPDRVTKRWLYSLDLSRLTRMWRELHPGEDYDPGDGCRTDNQRKRAYADLIYNHLN